MECHHGRFVVNLISVDRRYALFCLQMENGTKLNQ